MSFSIHFIKYDALLKAIFPKFVIHKHVKKMNKEKFIKPLKYPRRKCIKNPNVKTRRRRTNKKIQKKMLNLL